MSLYNVVRDFSDQSQGLSTVAELECLLEAASREIGFKYFALVHHVDLQAPPGGAIKIDNYPTSWYETLVSRKYYVDDPIHTVSQMTATGFKWSDVGQYIDLTTRQTEILKQAQKEGLQDGYSIPIHIPGDYSGSCSFGIHTGQVIRDENLPIAQFLASSAFESARQLRGSLNSRVLSLDKQKIKLTDRQLDCIVLLGQGKTDWEIATILGISSETVRKHFEAAKNRLSVVSRQQVLVRALFRNEISYNDVM